MLRALIGLLYILSASVSHAAEFKAYGFDTLSTIQKQHAQQAFVLVFWSTDCTYCHQELKRLSDVLKKHPQVDLVTVCTNGASSSAEAKQILDKADLRQVSRYQFAEDDEDMLRFKTDPKWHGELPRVYFYDKRHTINAFSGTLKPEFIDAWFSQVNSIAD